MCGTLHLEECVTWSAGVSPAIILGGIAEHSTKEDSWAEHMWILVVVFLGFEIRSPLYVADRAVLARAEEFCTTLEDPPARTEQEYHRTVHMF